MRRAGAGIPSPPLQLGHGMASSAVALIPARHRALSSESLSACQLAAVYDACGAPPPPPSYAFADTASLRTAVVAYNADADSATTTYGPISSWGVSAVTNMNRLFWGLAQFNADISSWDTSSVTDMGSMFGVRSTRALP